MDQAVNQVGLRAVGGDLGLVHVRDVRGHDEVQIQSRPGAVRGRGGSGVARGRHRRRPDPQLLRFADGGREAARLERPGRIQPFVFHKDVPEAQLPSDRFEGQQRSHPLPEGHDVLGVHNGHDLPVPPHRGFTPRERVPADFVPNPLQIIAREQDLPAGRAEVMEFTGGVPSAAPGALQVIKVSHVPPLQIKKSAPSARTNQLTRIIPYGPAKWKRQMLSTMHAD